MAALATRLNQRSSAALSADVRQQVRDAEAALRKYRVHHELHPSAETTQVMARLYRRIADLYDESARVSMMNARGVDPHGTCDFCGVRHSECEC